MYRFDAAFKSIRGCIGCDTCMNIGNGWVFRDDTEERNPHVLGADMTVFASPIYYYNINAQAKAGMERFSDNISALQGNKKAAPHLTSLDVD